MSRFLLTIFRRGVPGLVPIVYLSAESLGCLLGQTPDFSNENMEILEVRSLRGAKQRADNALFSYYTPISQVESVSRSTPLSSLLVSNSLSPIFMQFASLVAAKTRAYGSSTTAG